MSHPVYLVDPSIHEELNNKNSNQVDCQDENRPEPPSIAPFP